MLVSSDNFSPWLIITVFRECSMIYTVLLLGLFPFYLEAEAGITFQTGNVTYWSLGSTVSLSWDYDFKASDVLAKSFEFVQSGSTTPKVLASIGITTTKDPRVTITDKGTLSFPGAQLSDNGTYTFKVNVDLIGVHSDSVMVIILEQPQAETNCSQSIEVNEGDDVICLCYNTSGNPPPTASWSKEGSSGAIGGYGYLQKLLILKNIKTSQKGKYICQVRSHTLESEVSIQVNVRFKPKIVSFESGDTKGEHTAFLGRKITITSKASAYPSPSYTISHNGTELTDVVNGVKTIDPVNYSSAGVYKCVAVNKLGSDSDSFTLIVKEKIISNKSGNCGTEWYLFRITLICGIIVGMVLLYAIMWLRLRLSKKRDHSMQSQPGVCAGPSGEGLENASAYQELDLQKMNKSDDNYQSVRMTSRNTQSNTAPVEIENEAGYQELNEVRGNTDDNYQALNRVKAS